jgi:hypothetical protein
MHTPLGLATHARAPYTCHSTPIRQETTTLIATEVGAATTRSIGIVLHTIDSRSSRCSDEDMTTGSQSGVDLPFH